MKIGLYNLTSPNIGTNKIHATNNKLIDKIVDASLNQMQIVNQESVKNCDVLFVFVSGGGTEMCFKKQLDDFSGKLYLIATNINNSLAASMEILSYLRNKGIKSEIIHDSNNNIADKVCRKLTIGQTINYLQNAKFARIGKPSDWLIASEVDSSILKKQIGTQLIDISIDEFVNEIKHKKYEDDEYTAKLKSLSFDDTEIKNALYVYGALKRIVSKYKLDGLTVRCFDLLDCVHTTSCAALAMLNAQGILSSCEGDVPSLMSMTIIHKLIGMPTFQANPSVINTEENTIVLAHCTLPLNMSEDIKLATHFESGQGVAIKSEIPIGDATIFKTSGLLDDYFVSNATIVKNMNNAELCRTQILVRPDKSVNYFLQNSIGNHHIVVNGHHAKIIDDFYQAIS